MTTSSSNTEPPDYGRDTTNNLHSGESDHDLSSKSKEDGAVGLSAWIHNAALMGGLGSTLCPVGLFLA